MKPVIFLGPSLSHSEARTILEADYRPPVRRGDLMSLESGSRIVGIIDGVFMTEAAVGHREILSLLQNGIKVIGGSSMGALRAAELSSCGMVGVGEIYKMYSSGLIDGDDEVALVFNPETLEPLSEALVNLRFNVTRAVERNVISVTEADVLIEEIKRTYFPKRSYDLLLSIAHDRFGKDKSNGLRAFLGNHVKDLKKSDALMVIATIKTLIKS